MEGAETPSAWVISCSAIVAGCQAMAFQQTLGVKLLAKDSVINPEPSKWFEEVEATIAAEVRETHNSRTPSARSAGKKFHRLFHSGGKTQHQFGGKNLVQARFFQIPIDLLVHIGDKCFGSENPQHQAALA